MSQQVFLFPYKVGSFTTLALRRIANEYYAKVPFTNCSVSAAAAQARSDIVK